MKQFFCLLLFLFTLYAQDQVTVARRIKILIADFVSEAESGSILNGKLVAEQFELYALRSPKLLDNVLIKKRSSVAESSGFNPADISSIIARGRKYDIEGVLTGRILKGESNLYNIQIQLIDIQKKNIPSSRRIVNFAEVQGVPPSSKGVTAAVKQLIDTLEKGVFPRVDIITPDFDVVSIISINKDNFPEIQMRVSVVNQQGEPVSLPTDLFEVRENGNMVLYDIKQLNPQRAAEAQLNILFALDRSPSMLNDEKGIKSGKPFRRAKEATISFIKKLNQNDIIKIVAFDYNVLPLGDYTRDKSSYFSALQNLETGRGTGLYNVVKYCVEDIKDQPGDKVVIFLTDGKNDVRQASPEVKAVKLEDGLKIARKNTIPVYTVGFGGVDDSVMKRIAAATHSQYFKAASSKQLNELYMKIHKIIENQYIITYKSLAEKFGKVKVSLSVKDDERNFKLDSREQEKADIYKRKRQKETKQKGKQLKEKELVYRENKLKKEQAALKNEQKNLALQQEQLTNLQKQLTSQKEQLDSRAEALSNQTTELNAREKKVTRLEQELTALKNKLEKEKQLLQKKADRLAAAEKEIAAIKKNINQANTEILKFLREKIDYINKEAEKLEKQQ